MSWLQHPIILTGKQVQLIPLEKEHFDALIALSKNQRIWQHYVLDGSDTEKLHAALAESITERDNGKQYAFVITLNSSNTIIGSTRFLDIQPTHRKLEIGWTWLHPDYWGTQVNTESKLLLLQYCFETLQAKRVQLKTDENNLRSRKAIEKIEARLEGILRHDMIRDNGTSRNSAYYSIIDTEWIKTKKHLLQLLDGKER